VSLEVRHRRLCSGERLTFADRLLLLLLMPLSLVYAAIGRLRILLYRLGLFASYRASVPVISVGNLAVGGTGKTPTVDYLLRLLMAHGVKAAVVSRGYGGDGGKGKVTLVSAGDGLLVPPSVAGDEPYLLARRNPQALVLVAQRRADGVRQAEALGAQLILLDDGFQHRAVQRDFDLVLLDARRPFGNGLTLPAGLLREAPAALLRADAILLTRCGHQKDGELPDLRQPLLRSRHRLAETVLPLAGEPLPLAALTSRRCAAFAGIADPEGFFAALRCQGVTLSATLALPDHVAYGDERLQQLSQLAAQADCLLTTEKDGVKLMGQSLALPCYQVPLALEPENPEAFAALFAPFFPTE